MQPEIEEICAALSALRIPVAPEERLLHGMIAEALQRAGIAAQHEAVIAPRCRIDFLAGSVGIEVKRGRLEPSKLRAQAARYLASPLVSALILVTTDRAPLPDSISGKRVVVFGLNRLWGVALP
jgi:type II secretory pathway component PulL